MITHRFAEAAARRDGAAMAALFAEDVTYHTPTLTEDLHGKDLTLRYLAQGTRVVDELEYTDQVSDDERLILFWKGILGRRDLRGNSPGRRGGRPDPRHHRPATTLGSHGKLPGRDTPSAGRCRAAARLATR